jgi:type IV pilus assembly protein PilA
MHESRGPLRAQAGFTLIELMIVIAIIAVVASVAIPQLQRARLTANESSAAATLRAIAQAQAQISPSVSVDTDADGVGEPAYLAELAGTAPARQSFGGSPIAGGPGDELDPTILQAALGQVNNGVATHSGYIFQIWLPGATAGGLVPGVPEDNGGGKAGAPFPDADNSEIAWCAYAWPMRRNATGTPVFFISSQGQLLFTANRGPGVTYSGVGGGPAFDAALSVPGDITSSFQIGGLPSNDGNLWVPLR